MKKIYFLLISLIFCGCIIYAQTTVSGRITDDKSGLPLHDMNVIQLGQTLGTYTDSNGKFTLKTNQNPPFSLKISGIGYNSKIIEITKNNQHINISMVEIETLLNSIVISASRTPERIMESPISIERMDARDIQNTTAANFYDGLENIKGIEMNTNSLTFKSINTRGSATFANWRFVQLIDGMDNSTAALNFSMGNLLGISELDVNTIEILPGTSSALYGANAFNGIMFIESKNPFDYPGISVYAKSGITTQKSAGNNPFIDAGVRLAHKFNDKFAAKFNFSLLQGTDWYATDYKDYLHPGYDRNNPAYDCLNIYGDEVSHYMNFKQIALGSGVPSQFAKLMDSMTVSRTGYKESDLIDYTARSMKADISLHYRPDLLGMEIILSSKLATGNTIYQGGNRFAMKDFLFNQNKIELKNKNFFVRFYTTGEDAGKSYDTRFAAININRAWKSDEKWFTDYATSYVQYFMQILQTTGKTPTADAVNQYARNAAQKGYLEPGSQKFDSVFNKIISDPNFNTGAKFEDNSRIYHIDINYNFKDNIKFAETQIGGSWRQYSLNSHGSVFTDANGIINYQEIGAYVQAQKKFLNDRLKFTASLRFDKSVLFDGFLSPRLSFNYTAGKSRNLNFRASVQTGFRNPTTQDLYIGMDIMGKATYIGAAEDNPGRYVTPLLQVSQNGRNLGFPDYIQLSGNAAYDNAFLYDKAVKTNFSKVKPEKVIAYEVGFRGIIHEITVDFNLYYERYMNYISQSTVRVPYYGKTDLSDLDSNGKPLAISALENGDYKNFQIFTNSDEITNSYGLGLGVNWKFYKTYFIEANYVWNYAENSNEEKALNAPEHAIKLATGNEEVIKNLGYKINYRWHNAYSWNSSFVTGPVPANSVVDLQISYLISAWKSSLKLGCANILGHEYSNALGSGYIGSQFYISWMLKL